MPRPYCPACRLRYSPRSADRAPGECSRCGAVVPIQRTVDVNGWLASTVLAELRRRRKSRAAPQPRGAPPPRAAP